MTRKDFLVLRLEPWNLGSNAGMLPPQLYRSDFDVVVVVVVFVAFESHVLAIKRLFLREMLSKTKTTRNQNIIYFIRKIVAHLKLQNSLFLFLSFLI
jgi:hypothetical protein